MPEYQGQLRATGRLAIVVSQYNERVTGKLLEGAQACCREAQYPADAVDVVWVPGAYELPAAASALAATGRYRAIVGLGAVIRGETAHFDFVAGEAARGLNEVAIRTGIPCAFGVLTTETMDQALARAGGSAGNKGHEAAEAAIRTADVLAQIRKADAAS
jgi:6,7-dimethyl-8-ribityllumazine synthase